MAIYLPSGLVVKSLHDHVAAQVPHTIFTSRASAYANATQEVLAFSAVRVCLDTELYDGLGEMDTTVKTSMATATSALHLVDSSAPFTDVPGNSDVGAQIWNTTDNTYAKVTAVNSATDVTIDADIMANGETYKLYRSWFTAAADGYYIATGVLRVSGADVIADKMYAVKIEKEFTQMAQADFHSASASSLNLPISWQGYLTVGQRLTMSLYHTSTTSPTTIHSAASNETIFQVHRLS